MNKINKTYLSIDLDFWNQSAPDLKHARRFLSRVKNLGKKITLLDSHEDMVIPFNNSGCTNLINVDFHSDITNVYGSVEEDNGLYLSCGTWVNYVSKRNNFIWIHPHNEEEVMRGI